jgi:hypothetical protein
VAVQVQVVEARKNQKKRNNLLYLYCSYTAGFRTRIVQNDCNLPQKVK